MSKNHSVGLPKIPPDFGDDVTRPMSLHEFSEQVQVDRDLAIINKRHERVAKSIKMFWGHSDCAEYLQSLILSGGDGFGNARVGFTQEVMTALIDLARLNDSR